MTVTTEFLSVLDLGLDRTVDTLNCGFSDYIVPIQFDLAGWMHMVVGDGIDLELSRVLVRLDRAYASISDPEREGIGIRTLVVECGVP